MTAPAPLSEAIAAIEDDFALLGDWEERYGHLIALGKAAARLAPDERVEAARVRGCASQVWVVTRVDRDGGLEIRGESDSALVQGLVALVAGLLSGRRPHDILALDAEGLLARLGLAEALTPQRSNGLRALLARIRRDAAEAAGAAQPNP